MAHLINIHLYRVWTTLHLYGVLSSVKSNKGRSAEQSKFGDAIRVRREALNFSQEELAENVGCHRNYMGRIERGEQNITLKMMLRVARALKCSVQDLMKDAML